MPTRNQIDPGLKRAMNASLKAYCNGDSAFFEYVNDDVRVFGPNSSEPISGRKAFEASFGTNLAEYKRKVKTISQDIQMSGDQAIISQTLQVTANSISSHLRQTVIWAKTGGQWKMQHIHNALVGAPISTRKTPVSLAELRVLNDRIATAAAVVGVAQ